MGLELISRQVEQVVEGLLGVANLKQGHILVVGCSTSEVLGKRIGKAGSLEVAEAVFEPLARAAAQEKLWLAFQCCEHLNRALVVEEEAAERYGLEVVTVVPHAKAGGSLATTAFHKFRHPVVVESISAHAGIDIGDTFIGMHLKPVAVPVRLGIKSVGEAHLTAARTRPKLIGGERAIYCR